MDTALKMPKRKASSQLARADEEVPTATKVVSIVPDGDLQLNLDCEGECQGLIVRKQTLCAASPVFRKMLDQNSLFREVRATSRNADGIQILRLEDDDRDDMFIIMNIIHWQGPAVPQTLPLQTLHLVSRVCDKYDFGKSLHPWPRLWIRPYIGKIGADESVALLFVAITFGLGDLFSSITQYLILNTAPDDNGCLRLPTATNNGMEEWKWDDGIPDSVIGTSLDPLVVRAFTD